ncbi:unnamed protein product [Phytophthora lilii]|uniref:Unnamed protein product n=1 Tax=Phytophthora lilii TaxID=2077276 RepID=A0A9W6YIQ5_9STRA|nr:unnamed protein product [Phytophthora lilii]
MAMATSPSDGGTRRQRIERLIRRGDRLAEGDREHVAPPGDAVEPPLPTRRSSWTPQEDAKLRELVQRLGRRWSDVASHFPARDRKRCRERFVNHLAPSPSAAWSLEDDRKLLNLQQEVGPRWAELARRLGRTADSVKNRSLLLARRAEKRRRGEKKAPPKTWTKPEREKLRALVATHGARNWLFIASQLPGRTDLQCLQQWYRTLDDTVTKGKGTWTQTEDRVLKEKVEEIGRKWTQVRLGMDEVCEVVMAWCWCLGCSFLARTDREPMPGTISELRGAIDCPGQ